jgi:hypothetical protein
MRHLRSLLPLILLLAPLIVGCLKGKVALARQSGTVVTLRHAGSDPKAPLRVKAARAMSRGVS